MALKFCEPENGAAARLLSINPIAHLILSWHNSPINEVDSISIRLKQHLVERFSRIFLGLVLCSGACFDIHSLSAGNHFFKYRNRGGINGAYC